MDTDSIKKLVCMTWDVDGESPMFIRNNKALDRHLSELYQRSFGPREGLKRITDILEKNEIKGTFFIPGYILLRYTQNILEVKNLGHDFGLHGYYHENPAILDSNIETEILDKSKVVFTRILGKKPKIYRAPSWELNRGSFQKLVSSSITGDSSLMDSDRPYIIKVGNRKIVEMPIHWNLDDAEYWRHTHEMRSQPIIDPDSVYKIWRYELDGRIKNGGVFILTLHPWISGRWSFLKVVEKLILYARSKGLEFCTLGELSERCMKLADRQQIEEFELLPNNRLD
jgi:peptidoglycan/xylan/chitin deacetylase (PgdA/CDA1 family)